MANSTMRFSNWGRFYLVLICLLVTTMLLVGCVKVYPAATSELANQQPNMIEQKEPEAADLEKESLESEHSSSYAQVISRTIDAPISPNRVTITDYVRYFRTGDQITGVVRLTGSWEGDKHSWNLALLYRRSGDRLKEVIESWEPLRDDNLAFGFTAHQDGEYILRISISSTTSKSLLLGVSPAGWK